MPQMRIKWHPGAFAAVRTSPEAMSAVNELAEGIAARAGDGYTASPAETTGGKVRGRASVYTETFEAILDQARNHTLEGSL